MWDKLINYLHYPFVRYALVVGILIALCTSLLGVTLVLKRYSLIGEGLSHVAFGATAVASIMSLRFNLYITAPVTIFFAVMLLQSKRKSKLNGESAVAMLSVSSLAVGYLCINMFSSPTANVAADVCSTLFGSTSILTLTRSDVLVCIVLTIVVLSIYILFYNKIFAITFDEDFSEATGTKNSRYNLLMAIITAIVIVLAINLVGALLISALIVFPAVSAMTVFKSFKQVVISSAVFSVIGAAAGILISILIGSPVGSTIVIIDLIIFAMMQMISKIGGK